MSLETAIQHLLAAKRITAPSQSYRKDNPAEAAKVLTYLAGGARPDGVTSEMGLGLLEVEDVRRGSTPPPPPPPSVPPPPAPGSWTLAFNENFDTLNTNVWCSRHWWNGDSFWPTTEVHLWRPSQVSANGEASMVAQRATPPLTNFNGHTANSVGEPFSWYSGFLSSGGIRGVQAPGFAQKFGYFESRIKLPPAGVGFWAGLWMQGVNPNGLSSTYDDGWEIDVVEVVHQQPSKMEMHLHGAVEFGAQKDSPTALMGGGYHVYGLDWQPGFIAWYLDGQKVAQYNGPAFDSSPPHYVMLNFTIGGAQAWSGAPNSSTPSPATMLVDYVRVWKH